MIRTAADTNNSLGMRLTFGHSYDFTPSAKCVPGYMVGNTTQVAQTPIRRQRVTNAAECEALCNQVPSCMAAEFAHPTMDVLSFANGHPSCTLLPGCLERTRQPPPVRTDVMHRWGPFWPPGSTPRGVKWGMNATLVIASYAASLNWLRTLPAGIMDLVVYHKYDYGRERRPPLTARDVIRQLSEFEFCPSGKVHHPAAVCPSKCSCGHRPRSERPVLKYFATVPNYGQTHKLPFGGSREPFAFLQYILDFWENLPPVTIFTQVAALHAFAPLSANSQLPAGHPAPRSDGQSAHYEPPSCHLSP